MASPSSNRKAVYDAVTCVLSCCLQPDNDIQKMALERRKALEVIEDYPLILSEIIASNEEAVAERHLASVFLRNYLQKSQKLRDCFTPLPSWSQQLCLDLLELLNVQHLNIRIMVSHCLSYLLAKGHWEFMTPRLTEMMKSGNPDLMHNVVALLSHTIDFKFLNSLSIELHWFDNLLDIFKMTNLKSETRATSIGPIYVMMKCADNFTLKEWFPKLSEEFKKALSEPYSPTSSFQLKSEILKCLSNCMECYSELCYILIPPLLPAIGNLLTICCEHYRKIIRNVEKAPKDLSEDDYEEPSNFFDFVSSILNLVFWIIESKYYDVLIGDLDNLLYCIFIFMSCHSDMEQDLFLVYYEQDHHWVIRHLCYKIITTISVLQTSGRTNNGRLIFFKSMHNVFQKLNSELEESSNNDMLKVIYMTRLTESMMYGLGITSTRFCPTTVDTVFPLEYYITNWTSLMQNQHSMMLNGRILWLGGEFSLDLSPNILGVHLKAILQNLNNDNKYLFAPSAEALCNHLKNTKYMSAESQYVISTFAKDIIGCLLLVTQKSAAFPLKHSLKALGFFIKAHIEIATENIDAIEDLLIHTTIHHFKDPVIREVVRFIVVKLAQAQSFKTPIHDKFLTFLLNILHHVVPEELKDSQDKALDLLNTYSLYSPSMDDFFVLQAFMGAALLVTKDNNPQIDLIDENGCTLLRTLVVKASNQLKYLRDPVKGHPIVAEFPKLIDTLLHRRKIIPGNIVGPFVVLSIFSFPEVMEPHFRNILRDILSRNYQNFDSIRGTWAIFVFICMIRTSNTLNDLSIWPGRFGGSALQYLMRLWKTLPRFFRHLEKIERQIMVLSMTQIIQNCLENESDLEKLKAISIEYQYPDDPESTDVYMNGIEYLYYLVTEFLLQEHRYSRPVFETGNFADYGENEYAKKDEELHILFYNHQFNIDIVSHIVSLLKSGSEPYFSIVNKFFSRVFCHMLKQLGCVVPEHKLHERME